MKARKPGRKMILYNDALLDAVTGGVPDKKTIFYRMARNRTLIKEKLRVDLDTVNYVMKDARKNCASYGWTLPYVTTWVSGQDKYFPMLLEKDGEYYTDEKHRIYFEEGAITALKRQITYHKNQAMMFGAASKAQHVSRPRKKLWARCAADSSDGARRSQEVLESIQEANGG